MNPHELLTSLAEKPKKYFIGLMSGTSLDGLDMALCELQENGIHTKAKVLEFETRPYSKKLQADLTNYAYRSSTPQYQMCVLNAQLGRVFGRYVNDFIRKITAKGYKADIIASHGQTLLHAPTRLKTKPHSTLQIADGDHIAHLTGLPVVSDFRQKHVAIGGEGAPLSSYADYLLFNKKDQKRVFLNIGGISNFTLLDGSLEWGNLLTGDLGPGNTLIDRFVKLNYSDYQFDVNGIISSKGKVHQKSLYRLMDHDFFDKGFPKSTGQELFSERYVLERVSTNLDGDDLIATLATFTCKAIQVGLSKLDLDGAEIYVSGGGRFNPTIMKQLTEDHMHLQFREIQDLGVTADAKEALLFAVLANESLFGKGIYLKEFNRFVRLGKISFPD